MGLDTSHDAFHGSYTSFGKWRNEIAVKAGFNLITETVNYSFGTYTYDCPDIEWDQLTEIVVYGEWDELPENPLLILLCHSDCDGRIKSEHCLPLANALEELLPKVDLLYKSRTEQFIAGLRIAHEKDEDIIFS